jgi:hypothetical protein
MCRRPAGGGKETGKLENDRQETRWRRALETGRQGVLNGANENCMCRERKRCADLSASDTYLYAAKGRGARIFRRAMYIYVPRKEEVRGSFGERCIYVS